MAGERTERLTKPRDGVAEAGATQSRCPACLRVGVAALLVDAISASPVGLVAVEGIANDGAEVARQGADIVAMELRAEPGIGLLEYSQRVVAIGAKELRDREIKVIEFMQVSEQQPLAVLFGMGLLASACCSAYPCIFVKARALFGSGAGSTRARLISAKEGGDQEVTEGLGQFGVTQ